MKQTYMYLWYPLFQAQWDKCDHRNHQVQNYLVKGHHLESMNVGMDDNISI
jgi:hypothetical protein